VDDADDEVCGRDGAEQPDSGPELEDLVTRDHVDFWEYGGTSRRPVLSVPEGEDMETAVKEYMERNKFWTAVWFESDHGNYHLIKLEGWQ